MDLTLAIAINRNQKDHTLAEREAAHEILSACGAEGVQPVIRFPIAPERRAQVVATNAHGG